MSKPYYVKFDIPQDLVSAVYEAVRLAKQSGKIRKGTNETTKAIERGISKLVVIAEDVEPPEVVAHLPILCDERSSKYVFVPSKKDLGGALGIDVGSAAATIIDPGESQQILDQITNTIDSIKNKSE
ncbi:Ribosome-associated protein L7Ae-like protein [Candidatus Nitrosocosmicus oleophilus]|jgi:large subunit ribosomal protein L7Ae|uniref:Large ribosomal subunit protein eL8 n=1 Tax=Candidatus Nitrosocosmicus oleophilus TaxID=1353260 RepID=A0A654M6Q8_9ARCH|nr:50S ribosomal protein L7Ae [Candidatus Nitrosocosmicus oleophilus]ALI35142.1 Ribosome-associated protein L7Ae-like protein [Candidatus Nitrosocosmicus oleophilus]